MLKFFLLYFWGVFRTRFPSDTCPEYLALSKIFDGEKTSRKASEELERCVSHRVNSPTIPSDELDGCLTYEKCSIGSDQLNLSQDSSWFCFRAQTQIDLFSTPRQKFRK